MHARECMPFFSYGDFWFFWDSTQVKPFKVWYKTIMINKACCLIGSLMNKGWSREVLRQFFWDIRFDGYLFLFRANKKNTHTDHYNRITRELDNGVESGRLKVKKKLFLSGWPLLTIFKLLLEVTLQEAIIGILWANRNLTTWRRMNRKNAAC